MNSCAENWVAMEDRGSLALINKGRRRDDGTFLSALADEIFQLHHSPRTMRHFFGNLSRTWHSLWQNEHFEGNSQEKTKNALKMISILANGRICTDHPDTIPWDVTRFLDLCDWQVYIVGFISVYYTDILTRDMFITKQKGYKKTGAAYNPV